MEKKNEEEIGQGVQKDFLSWLTSFSKLAEKDVVVSFLIKKDHVEFLRCTASDLVFDDEEPKKDLPKNNLGAAVNLEINKESYIG